MIEVKLIYCIRKNNRLFVSQMTEKTTCFEQLQDARIDRENGIIYGVCVIREGAAKGHGIKIDSTSLETVRDVANEFPNGIKVKLRHREEGEFQSVVDQVCGVIKNFSISGTKAIGNFHILKSLNSSTKDKIFEMAEVMPDQFGFSIVFSGPPKVKDGFKFLRCQELQSIDLADKPAATDGLFEEKSMSIKYKSGDSGEHHAECGCSSCKDKSMEAEKKKDEKKMEELQTAVATLTELVTKLSEKIAAPPAIASLSYKDKDGKDVQLSVAELAQTHAENIQLAEKNKKDAVINKMSSEGRVVTNPETGVAYKLEELSTLPLATLQFAAVNAPKIPLAAKSIFRGAEKKTASADPTLKGDELVTASLEEKGYDNLEAMLATPIGKSVEHV